MSKPKTHKFRGRKYLLSRREVDGWCDNLDGPREIWVSPTVYGKGELETWIHEGLHAEFPRKSEQDVDRIATVLSGFLWRLGYRAKKKR